MRDSLIEDTDDEEGAWECGACGAEVSYDDDICSHCGANISEVDGVAEDLPEETSTAGESTDGLVKPKEKSMNRPIITEAGNTQPQEQKPPAPVEEATLSKSPDLPLATQMPEWDLLPAHTMLVRRRLLKK
jgi:hypothetical protein